MFKIIAVPKFNLARKRAASYFTLQNLMSRCPLSQTDVTVSPLGFCVLAHKMLDVSIGAHPQDSLVANGDVEKPRNRNENL